MQRLRQLSAASTLPHGGSRQIAQREIPPGAVPACGSGRVRRLSNSGTEYASEPGMKAGRGGEDDERLGNAAMRPSPVTRRAPAHAPVPPRRRERQHAGEVPRGGRRLVERDRGGLPRSARQRSSQFPAAHEGADKWRQTSAHKTVHSKPVHTKPQQNSSAHNCDSSCETARCVAVTRSAESSAQFHARRQTSGRAGHASLLTILRRSALQTL